ncbi:hypothetical protein Q9L58_001936 [Maublancomyces gigas]|uniref:Uncharacterized protein n=1 Tax=Discina gigas TaxID=1032678 RepID=A0ABR3GSZ2_9PEZI
MSDTIAPTDAPLPTSSSASAPSGPPTVAQIPAPAGPLFALKAGVISKVLPWGPGDFILANRAFRAVYAKHVQMHRDKWLLLPPGVIDTAIAALKQENPRLFGCFEGDWYLMWGLYKRHSQRWRQSPPEKEAVDATGEA